jgi:3-hydroxyacyl-CoA dehydrogenase/enoyl-CoA hydratase/3-hydroxybutyryl-CoA epimerase
MEALLAPTSVFATNTSSLSVADIAQAAVHPERVLGLHFFNPVPKMPLVEIVRGPATSQEAVGMALAIAKKMGKTPVIVKDTPGFIVNRILMPYLAGAMGMLGAPDRVKQVDHEMVDFGMPMGPFALLDKIGLDVAAKVAGVLAAAFPRNGNGQQGTGPRLLEAMVQAGHLGAKTGKGFYSYKTSGETTGVSEELSRALAAVREGSGMANGDAGGASIAETLIDDMINEAAMLLGEGAVENPETIDLAMVFGTGFPPFRGGLLRHADAVGLSQVATRLESRGVSPAPLLKSQERFYK